MTGFASAKRNKIPIFIFVLFFTAWFNCSILDTGFCTRNDGTYKHSGDLPMSVV